VRGSNQREGNRQWRSCAGILVAISVFVCAGARAQDVQPDQLRAPYQSLRARQAAAAAVLADQMLRIATDKTLAKLPPPPPKPGAKPDPNADACLPIDWIEITGIELVSREDVAKATKPFTHACQGNLTVQSLMVTINALHGSKGYITTQAYLPKQDLKKTRLLKIEIKVGRIAEIVYDEKPKWADGSYFQRLRQNFVAILAAKDVPAFFASLDTFAETLDDPIEGSLFFGPETRLSRAQVIKPGDVLNIENIQQTLDQLNRAASSRAVSKLDPGKEPGTSVVRITNPANDAFRTTVGYDTYGSKLTGISRYRAEVARDNLVGVNDTWTGSVTSSLRTNELSGAVSAPLGWGSLAFDAKYTESITPLSDIAELFTQSVTIGSTANFTAYRGTDGKLDFSAGIRGYTNDRTINDVRLTPQLLSALDFGVTRTVTLGKNGLLTLGTKGSFGIRAFGSVPDQSSADHTVPRSHFKKLAANVGLQWNILDGLVLSSALTGQYTKLPLYSPDQFTIGGLTSVRGFNAFPVVGDRGAHWRNELIAKLPADSIMDAINWKSAMWLANRLKAMETYAFLDAGYVSDIASSRVTKLAGTGVGFRIKDSRLTVDWSVARGIHQRGPTTPVATEVFVNVGWKVF
jgi:hemolysin activation/secretion protein